MSLSQLSLHVLCLCSLGLSTALSHPVFLFSFLPSFILFFQCQPIFMFFLSLGTLLSYPLLLYISHSNLKKTIETYGIDHTDHSFSPSFTATLSLPLSLLLSFIDYILLRLHVRPGALSGLVKPSRYNTVTSLSCSRSHSPSPVGPSALTRLMQAHISKALQPWPPFTDSHTHHPGSGPATASHDSTAVPQEPSPKNFQVLFFFKYPPMK